MDLPPGTRNYLTPEGYARLIGAIEETQRARAIAYRDGDGRRVSELDQVLDALAVRRELAEVVDPALQAPGRVRFGAWVRIAGEVERELRIVGIDEADAARGWISWRSPLARALIDAETGEDRVVRTPRGDEEVTVIDVRFRRGVDNP